VLAFFGLAKDHSIMVHSQIFDMINYGNGFTFSDVYQMPTYLRNFYYNKLVDSKKKESEQIKKTNSQKSSKVRIR
jgi:hypothetical protein